MQPQPHHEASPVLSGAPLSRAHRAAIVVHGRAQTPAYMLDELVSPLDLDDVAYVLPRADDGSWYPGRYFDPREANEPWLGAALAALTRAIGVATSAGLAPEQIVLAGFSQGACLVCEHLLRLPARYAGVALLTGCLLGPEGTTPTGVIPRVPIYVGTREEDEWIPAGDVRRAASALARAGAEVSLDVREPGPHQIDAEDVLAVRGLLV
jgi:phospholipase/carboxylesterase